MKLKNCIYIIMLILVLLSCISTVNATSNENISMNENHNQTYKINDLHNTSDHNNLHEDEYDDENETDDDEYENGDNDDYNETEEEYEDIDPDNVNETDDEDEDEEEELDFNDDELDDEELEEYLECINMPNDLYLKFVKYLIKEKGFRFNNLYSEEDEGYHIYASKIYKGKSYDGKEIIINEGDSYYISKLRANHILDSYYPDAIYYYNNSNFLDEAYLGWLKWEEKYQVSLNISNNTNIINSTISTTPTKELPLQFDLRNINGNNYVTPIKNQGNENNCWAFASIAALESHLLKSENITYEFSNNLNLSENNLKNAMSSRGEKGTEIPVNNGGISNMAIAYFIRWSGPLLESQDEYSTNESLEDYKAFKHVQGIKYIKARNSSLDNYEIKQSIMNYGGVVTSLLWNNKFINGPNYYCYNANLTNKSDGHEICIIGWDDNYSANNFKHKPQGNGAFIIKNSWGKYQGINGYYYVSYYDTTLAHREEIELNGAVGYSFTLVENNTNYGKNYYHNPLGVTYWFDNHTAKCVSYRNKWIAHCNETLVACGVYVKNISYCQVKVCVNNNNITVKNMLLLEYAGFHTITFDTPIKINKSQTFTIEVTLLSNTIIPIPLEVQVNYMENNISKPLYLPTSKANQSELLTTNGWIDIRTLFKNSNICINAYTQYEDLLPTKIEAYDDLTINYGENITATLYDLNDTTLKNMELTFCVNDEEYVAITNENGQATIPINISGTYRISIHYYGNEKYADSRKTITLTINPKPRENVIIELNATDISSPIEITLTSSKGKPLSGKTVKIKFTGKKIITKTLDKNGKCKLNKNLKNPVKIKITFEGDKDYNKKIKTKYLWKKIKIEGLKTTQTSNYNDKIQLTIKAKKLTVNLKISKKKYKIKFKKGKATFKVNKYKLKKGKKYTLIFTKNSKLYKIDEKHTLKIKK